MVAIDTSTWVAFVQGQDGADVERLDRSLASGNMAFPLIVLTEILSDPKLPAQQRAIVLNLPTIEVTEGYWTRAAATRGKVLEHQLRARLPDTLIAQSCLDHDVALITRDRDFRHFSKHCGLRLAQ
jgi:predicted nucleic acid-binding protein